MSDLMPRMHAVRMLAVIALLTLVGIFDHELWTPDEPRDAEISREIGFHALPTLNGQPHVEKPPLYFWSVHATYQLFGVQASSARVPSILFSWGTLIFTWLLARRMFGRDAAWRACLFLATTIVYFLVTHKCLVDNALVFMTTGCFYWLYEAQASERKLGRYLLAYLFAAGAALTKGAVGVGLVAATFFCFVIWMRKPVEILRAWPWLAVLVVAAPVGAWTVSLPFDARATFFLENQWGRFSGEWIGGGHLRPFWYYGPAFLYALAPWGLAAFAAIPWLRRRDEDTPAKRYLVAWIVLGVLMLSLAATKRELYLLPLAPATAILAAGWIERGSERLRGVAARTGLVLLAVGHLSAASVAAWLGDWTALGLTLVLGAAMTLAARGSRDALGLAVASVLVAAMLVAVPVLDREKNLAPFARALPPQVSPVPAFRPDETTLAVIPFYTGRRVVPLESLGDAVRAAETKPAWIVVVLKQGREAVPSGLEESYPYVWLKDGNLGRRMILLSNVER
jgi:4-amino-4-deoxy-L-arabinose transferase-like glycosyltransferase